MSAKNKTIHLQQVLAANTMQPGNYEYRIVKLVNSVEYKCGDRLTKDQVEVLCSPASKWTVNIT